MLFHSIIKSTRLDKWMFLKKFFQNPREIGSVVPSSSRLTQKMLEPVRWEEAGTIVELGAGTGVFTQAIKEKIRPGCKVAVFEKDNDLRCGLQNLYDGFHVFKNAADLKEELSRAGLGKADFIISGLPFANFSPADRSRIIGQIKESLNENGVFITFQYSLQMKSMLQKEFDQVQISLVPWNVPSAFVYECRQQPVLTKQAWTEYGNERTE